MTGEDQGSKSGFDDGLTGSMHLGRGAHVWEWEEESEARGDEVTRLIETRSRTGAHGEVPGRCLSEKEGLSNNDHSPIVKPLTF